MARKSRRKAKPARFTTLTEQLAKDFPDPQERFVHAADVRAFIQGRLASGMYRPGRTKYEQVVRDARALADDCAVQRASALRAATLIEEMRGAK